MSAPTTASLSDLIAAMKGFDTLNGWDVLVSYRQDALNKMLLDIMADTALMTIPEWDVSPKGSIKIYRVALTLANPVLQFKGSDGRVELFFDLAGSYQDKKEGSEAEKIPEHTQLVVSTRLVHVRGSIVGEGTVSSHFTPDEGASGHGHEKITIMKPGQKQAASVAIDLQHVEVRCRAAPGKPELSEEQTKFLKGLVAVGINRHFREAAGLTFYLGCVSSTPATSPNSIVLHPRAFCFSTVPASSDQSDDGALCLWIAVQDGNGNYAVPTEDKPLSLTISGMSYNPIPSGKTASVIFAHDLMANLFLLPALQAKSCTNVRCTSVKGSDGMVFKYKLPSRKIHVDGKDEEYHAWLNTTNENKHLDALDFDMTDEEATMNILTTMSDVALPPLSETKTKCQVTTEWKSKEIRLCWSYHHDSIFKDLTTNERGAAKLTFSLYGNGTWTGVGNNLGIYITHPASFGTPKTEFDGGPWEKVLNGFSGKVPDEYTKLNPAVPSLDFNFSALDYFLTTNLVLPGATLFNADKPDGNGLGVPRDTVVAGTIATVHPVKLAAMTGTVGGGAAVQSLLAPQMLQRRAAQASSALLKAVVRPLPATVGAAMQAPAAAETAGTGGVVGPPKHESQLAADLLDPNTLMLMELTVAASDATNPGLAIWRVLKKHGYSEISDRTCEQMLNMAPGDLTAPLPGTAPDHDVVAGEVAALSVTASSSSPVSKDSPAANGNANGNESFSVRFFDGKYQIAGGATDEYLVVDPNSGLITVKGVEVLPSSVLSPDGVHYVTSWSIPTSRYAVTFKSTLQADGTFTKSFTGTVTDVATGGETPVSGTVIVQIAEKTWWEKFNSQPTAIVAIASFIITAVSLPIGVMGLVLTIRSMKSDGTDRDDMSESDAQRVRERQASNRNNGERAMTEIQQQVEHIARAVTNFRLREPTTAELLRIKVKAEIEKRLQETLGNNNQELLRKKLKGEVSLTNEIKYVNQSIGNAVEAVLIQMHRAGLRDSIQSWAKLGLLEESQVEATTTDVLKSLAEEHTRPFVEGSGIGTGDKMKSTLAEMEMRKRIIELLTEKHEVTIAEVMKRVETAEKTATDAKKVEDKAVQDYNAKKAEKVEAGKKAEYDAALLQLENEMKSAKTERQKRDKELKTEADAKAKAEKEKTEREKEAKKVEKELAEAKKRAEKAAKKGRK
ncbi:hypothetical protein CONLIGDRAFT_666337 [Coniochaeta ligniaria NRRL 30616]|uniref:Uncharacterized protein n=1 Tax=Coniochaeta ligniaria NRRL 30616 TaxID=1408157 RepID=A0A1J7J095_9PEZI|nr:hypothetical protein CONLIGDRAFT_666337 [Coniochaeta ligniaria NRRL 30616]